MQTFSVPQGNRPYMADGQVLISSRETHSSSLFLLIYTRYAGIVKSHDLRQKVECFLMKGRWDEPWGQDRLHRRSTLTGMANSPDTFLARLTAALTQVLKVLIIFISCAGRVKNLYFHVVRCLLTLNIKIVRAMIVGPTSSSCDARLTVCSMSHVAPCTKLSCIMHLPEYPQLRADFHYSLRWDKWNSPNPGHCFFYKSLIVKWWLWAHDHTQLLIIAIHLVGMTSIKVCLNNTLITPIHLPTAWLGLWGGWVHIPGSIVLEYIMHGLALIITFCSICFFRR